MDQPDYEQPQTGMHSHRRQGDHALATPRAPEPPKDKTMPRAKKRLLILVAIVVGGLLILAAILYWLHARQFQNTDDAFIDGHVSQIAPQIAGRIVALKVHDNEEVHPGQLLAEIDPRDYEVRLTQAEGRRSQAAAQVQLERAGIGQAQANVTVAEADYDRARRDLKRFRHIDPKAISRQQLDQSDADAKSAAARVEAARKSVEAARAQVGSAEATLVAAKAEVKNAQLQLSYTKIVSPIDGHVTRRTLELGNVVTPGQPLLAIVSGDLWVTANFKETQLTRMRAGQPVDIHIDAFPEVDFHGHVDSFQRGSGQVFSSLPAENATGNYVKVVQRIPVKILFDDAEQRDRYPLAPGLSVMPRVRVR